MTVASDSFRNWIREQVLTVLNRKNSQSPLLIWCDPWRTWRDLLVAAAEDDTFELWADGAHELLLRERLYTQSSKPMVVWLPTQREQIGYLKVFELEAEAVQELSLAEALMQYGVEIPADQVADLKPLLPAHAREWIDYPLQYWRDNLSKGQIKSALVDDDLFLTVLASYGKSVSDLISADRMSVLNRRAVEDYGLPALLTSGAVPTNAQLDLDHWRLQAVASLLVTEAAVSSPSTPPSDRDRLIQSGAARDRSLKLFGRWQKQIDLLDYFETVTAKADSLTTLQYWAKSLNEIPKPLSSQAAEASFFQVEVERVAQIDDFASLAKYLDTRCESYEAHAKGFWGERARTRVRWDSLAELANAARLLYQQSAIEHGWQAPAEAVSWFTEIGWRVDQAGESLFTEDAFLPGGLVGVRARLRRAYLRHLDRVNAAFSELISHAGMHKLRLEYAGDVIKGLVEQASPKDPVAILVLDACRFDLGCRIAEELNRGEPTRRADVRAARAPVPSITALGMPFCLPVETSKLRVDLPEHEASSWNVKVDDFDGNLAIAGQRQEWLKKNFKLKTGALLSANSVLNSDNPEAITIKSLGRLAFVFDDDFDDHDCVLKPFGLDDRVERYGALIRRLRSAGYNTVLVVTDHGFFHWDPAPDEKDLAKPEGTILWRSRRAIVGRALKHGSAITVKVSGSDLECSVPRSVNAFKTYGGLGFFHGGATLQELVIPVVTVRWPRKARKIEVVLKPVQQIVSLRPRIEVEPAAVDKDLYGVVDEKLLGRRVTVKVMHRESGKVLFRSDAVVSLEPGGDLKAVELAKVEGAEGRAGSPLEVQVVDADDEEILDRGSATLMVELDEWF